METSDAQNLDDLPSQPIPAIRRDRFAERLQYRSGRGPRHFRHRQCDNRRRRPKQASLKEIRSSRKLAEKSWDRVRAPAPNCDCSCPRGAFVLWRLFGLRAVPFRLWGGGVGLILLVVFQQAVM